MGEKKWTIKMLISAFICELIGGWYLDLIFYDGKQQRSWQLNRLKVGIIYNTKRRNILKQYCSDHSTNNKDIERDTSNPVGIKD